MQTLPLTTSLVEFVAPACWLASSDQIRMQGADAISLPPSVPSLPADVDGSGRASQMSCSRTSELLSVASGSDVELPSDVSDSDGGAPNAFDEACDDAEEDEAQVELDALFEQSSSSSVPSPEVARNLSMRHEVAEFYSPPRVVPAAQMRGLRGSLSLDILTGWDFKDIGLQQLSVALLTTLSIRMLILSPPCTAFSALQRLWNFKTISREAAEAKLEEGLVFLRHAMTCCRRQLDEGRYFCFEHPASASSWQYDVVKALMCFPGVFCITFDQCQLGLASKVEKKPMRKRTRIMTNCWQLASYFSGKVCDGSHEHQTIQGSEGGVPRSTWAQYYPPQMVDLIVAGTVAAM